MGLLRKIILLPKRLRLLETEVATLREMHILHRADRPILTEYLDGGIIKSVHYDALEEIQAERERAGIEPVPVVPALPEDEPATADWDD